MQLKWQNFQVLYLIYYWYVVLVTIIIYASEFNTKNIKLVIGLISQKFNFARLSLIAMLKSRA